MIPKDTPALTCTAFRRKCALRCKYRDDVREILLPTRSTDLLIPSFLIPSP